MSPSCTRQPTVVRLRALPVLALLLAALASTPAHALVRFDFEQSFYAHPGRQVWDFSLVKADATYHIFYHTIAEATPHATMADTIWHATSPDLRHWNPPQPVVLAGSGDWDASAVWAPDVFRDEAGARWVMGYTGVDSRQNQRLGLAYSDDLDTWTVEPANAVLEPDSTAFIWSPSRTWSDFRDPYFWFAGGQWNVINTAKQWTTAATGVLHHATSQDLLTWTEQPPLFLNDGVESFRVLESSQYHEIGGVHHLLFGEFDTIGTSHVAAADKAALSMAQRNFIDNGYAPELDEFDPGVHIFSRICPFPAAEGGLLSYVVRFDTMLVSADDTELTVHKPHPLDEQWPDRAGTATLGNPTFGDNPLWRDEPSVGLVGNGYFGSREYYQGPLSSRGAPGSELGTLATGWMTSRPFRIEGNRMTLLVGGGNDPDNLEVALIDAKSGETIFAETGNDTSLMTLRTWDLTDHAGRMCRIRITDSATGPMGFINVDEIVESRVAVAAAGDAPPPLVSAHGAVPNPFNPVTEIRFRLAAPARAEVRIHDLRGRVVWSDGGRGRAAGEQGTVWRGVDGGGRPVAAGSYLYRILVDGRPAARGKISLVR